MDIKVTLFDAADLEKMKQAFPPAFAEAVENAIFRGVTRAIRVALKEGWITGLPRPKIDPPPPQPDPPPPPPARAETERKVRRMRDVLKTVGDRPHGYITTDEAAAHLSGMADHMAKWTIGQWLLDGVVEGVIVASFTPPTKGCPGRVMVKTESLLERERKRQTNRASMPQIGAMQRARQSNGGAAQA